MKTKTFISKHELFNASVDIECNITFNDVIDIIESCDYSEKSEIRKIIDNNYDDIDFDEVYSIVNNFNFSKHELKEMKNILFDDIETPLYDDIETSLYDELKNRIMIAALKKYDLEELQKRLDIKYY
jgi:ribosome-interacting GTPase 1